MQNNQTPRNPRARAQQQYKIARSNLLIMLVLTVVNIVLLVAEADTMLLFSATVPYYLSAVSMSLFAEYSQVAFVGFGIVAVTLVIYLLCWIFSKRHYGWMIAALVFFVLDSIAMIGLYILAEDFSYKDGNWCFGSRSSVENSAWFCMMLHRLRRELQQES